MLELGEHFSGAADKGLNSPLWGTQLVWSVDRAVTLGLGAVSSSPM